MEVQNFISIIPLEILTRIFSFLPRRDRFICMCMNTRWKEAMDVPYLWKHMSVRLDVDFFEVSTIQLTIEYCKYIKSLELRFEYPEEPMQWINYKMMDITKRTYRFLSIFVNKNLQIQKLSFNNFCDFYRSKKILYYLSMFLRSQYNIKIISFNGSYFSKKALIKILTSSIAANHSSIEYLDIQNSYYEHDFRLLPGQFNELSEQLSACITNIDNLLVLKIDFESLLSNNVLLRLLNNKCNTLEYLDIRVAGHDLNNIWRSLHLYSNSMWINLKKKFVDLKVSITFYDVIYKNEIIEQILTRSLPLYCVSWITDTILLKELYTFTLMQYSKTLRVVKIHIKSSSLDDLLILALSNCPELKYIEFSGVINDMANVHERFRQSNFSGFKNEHSARDLKNYRVISSKERLYKNNSMDNFDNKLYKLHGYDMNIDVM